MDLAECTYGRMVVTKKLDVGFVVGLTYSCLPDDAKFLDDIDRLNKTIPLVSFPDGERGIHPINLTPYENIDRA